MDCPGWEYGTGLVVLGVLTAGLSMLALVSSGAPRAKAAAFTYLGLALGTFGAALLGLSLTSAGRVPAVAALPVVIVLVLATRWLWGRFWRGLAKFAKAPSE